MDNTKVNDRLDQLQELDLCERCGSPTKSGEILLDVNNLIHEDINIVFRKEPRIISVKNNYDWVEVHAWDSYAAYFTDRHNKIGKILARNIRNIKIGDRTIKQILGARYWKGYKIYDFLQRWSVQSLATMAHPENRIQNIWKRRTKKSPLRMNYPLETYPRGFQEWVSANQDMRIVLPNEKFFVMTSHKCAKPSKHPGFVQGATLNPCRAVPQKVRPDSNDSDKKESQHIEVNGVTLQTTIDINTAACQIHGMPNIYLLKWLYTKNFQRSKIKDMINTYLLRNHNLVLQVPVEKVFENDLFKVLSPAILLLEATPNDYRQWQFIFEYKTPEEFSLALLNAIWTDIPQELALEICLTIVTAKRNYEDADTYRIRLKKERPGVFKFVEDFFQLKQAGDTCEEQLAVFHPRLTIGTGFFSKTMTIKGLTDPIADVVLRQVVLRAQEQKGWKVEEIPNYRE